jgi:hypothetical protein
VVRHDAEREDVDAEPATRLENQVDEVPVVVRGVEEGLSIDGTVEDVEHVSRFRDPFGSGHGERPPSPEDRKVVPT